MKKVAIGVVAVAVLAAGSTVAALRLLAGPSNEAASLAPPQSALYTNLSLDPPLEQKLALRRLLTKFPEGEVPEDLATSLLDGAVEDLGLSFRDDVEPWLGDEIAFFFADVGNARAGTPPAVALLVATEDPAATEAAVEKSLRRTEGASAEPASYRGVRYDRLDDAAVGIVEGFLVVGTEQGLRAAVDATQGESLADSEEFAEATDSLRENRLAISYTNRLAEGLAALGDPGSEAFLEVGPAGGLGSGTGAGVLFARGDGLVFESTGEVPEEEPAASITKAAAEPGLLPELPAGSWAALTMPQLGETIRDTLDLIPEEAGGPESVEQGLAMVGLDLEEDFLRWMGDLGGFGIGAAPEEVGGGLVITSSDREASIRAVERIGLLLKEEGVAADLDEPGVPAGFTIPIPDLPQDLVVAADEADGNVSITFGRRARQAIGGETLAGTEAFAAAEEGLGADFSSSFYADLSGILELVDAIPEIQNDPDYRDVRPFLAPFSYAIAGTKVEGDTVITRFVIGVS